MQGEVYRKARAILQRYPGKVQVIIRAMDSGRALRMKSGVADSDMLRDELIALLGNENVL